MKQSFGLTNKNIYIRYVWYSSLEYTESDVWDSLVPRSDFGINIPKYSEITISEYFLESIFQIPILWILVPLRKFCPIMILSCNLIMDGGGYFQYLKYCFNFCPQPSILNYKSLPVKLQFNFLFWTELGIISKLLRLKFVAQP